MQSTLDPVVFPRVTPEPGLPESAFTSFTVDQPFPSRAVDIGFVSHVVDGTLRFTGAEFFPIPLDPRSVLPPGFTVQRQHVDPGRVIQGSFWLERGRGPSGSQPSASTASAGCATERGTVVTIRILRTGC